MFSTNSFKDVSHHLHPILLQLLARCTILAASSRSTTKPKMSTSGKYSSVFGVTSLRSMPTSVKRGSLRPNPSATLWGRRECQRSCSHHDLRRARMPVSRRQHPSLVSTGCLCMPALILSFLARSHSLHHLRSFPNSVPLLLA